MCSIDIREKIIEVYLEGEESLRSVAERFKVSFSFVYRIWTKYKETGDLSPLPHSGGKTYKITEEKFEEIIKEIGEETDLTQKEIAKICKEKLRVEVSQSTISRRLAQLNISRKKHITIRKEKQKR